MFEDIDIEAGFKAASEKMKDLTADIRETQDAVIAVEKKIKVLAERSGEAAALVNTGGGFWPDYKMARDFGQIILKAVGRRSLAEDRWEYKDQVTYDNIYGGFTVPEQFAGWIINRMQEYGVFRRNATLVPMRAPVFNFPKIDDEVTVYCIGEGEDVDTSDMKFKGFKMAPIKLAALTAISSELSEDTIVGIAELVGASMARAMARKEDLLGFLGDGTSTYYNRIGVLGAILRIDPVPANIGCIHIQGTAGAWSAITLYDFEQVAGLLPSQYDRNAKWYCSKRFFMQVMYSLAADNGVATMMELMSGKKFREFLGYPVEFVESMPQTKAAADHIPCILADLSACYLGEARRLTIDKSNERYFESDKIGIRATERIDVNTVAAVGDGDEIGAAVALMADIA